MFDFPSSGGFMPHGHCYLWDPELLWIQVISNGAVALAYLAIAVSLVHLVRSIKLPFAPVYLAFGAFILLCGLTHVLDIVVIWRPIYWIDGGLRVVTALASVGTAVLLIPLLPRARRLAALHEAETRRSRADLERALAKEAQTRGELEVVAADLEAVARATAEELDAARASLETERRRTAEKSAELSDLQQRLAMGRSDP